MLEDLKSARNKVSQAPWPFRLNMVLQMEDDANPCQIWVASWMSHACVLLSSQSVCKIFQDLIILEDALWITIWSLKLFIMEFLKSLAL
jgi:hypothetical protein